jgi:hypothetical protein
MIRAEAGKIIGFLGHLLKSVVDAIEPQVLAALEGLNVFRGHGIDPVRRLRTMIRDVCIHAARKGRQDLVHIGIHLVLVFDHAFLGS